MKSLNGNVLNVPTNLHKVSNECGEHVNTTNPPRDTYNKYKCDSEISVLKAKFESFAENVSSKFQALTKEVADIKENKVYSIIILENTVHELKKEKYDLIKANNDLREKNEVLHQKISDFNSTVQRLEDEKQSLITTIKLVQKETQTVQPNLNDRMQNLENENKSLSTALTLLQHELDNTQQHKWKVVKTKYNKPPPETPAGSNTIETKNQYTTLSVTDSEHDDIPARKTQQILDETSNTTKHSNIQMVGKSSGPSNSNESSRDSQRSQPRIVILGDSMLKHLDTKRMQNGLKKGKVTIKTFPGAGIEQMKHYAVPTLITKPKTLIFHVGTNDLHNKTPEDLINAMNDLGETIHRQNNDLELIWSEIITRTDDPNLAEKVNVVNAELAKLCADKGWGLIKHNNIKGSLLNSSGLHLNKHGTTTLAKNIKQFLSSH